jgi:hypothetical protein
MEDVVHIRWLLSCSAGYGNAGTLYSQDPDSLTFLAHHVQQALSIMLIHGLPEIHFEKRTWIVHVVFLVGMPTICRIRIPVIPMVENTFPQRAIDNC